MLKVLVVTDEPWVRNEVHATLTAPEFTLVDHAEPATAADVAVAEEVDLLVADLQIGAMGGMAVTRAVRETTGDTSTPGLPVVLLLDRGADEFLAKRAGAAAWLTKPFTSHEMQNAVAAALASRLAPPTAEDQTG